MQYPGINASFLFYLKKVKKTLTLSSRHSFALLEIKSSLLENVQNQLLPVRKRDFRMSRAGAGLSI